MKHFYNAIEFPTLSIAYIWNSILEDKSLDKINIWDILDQALAHDECGEVHQALACLDEIAEKIPNTAKYQKLVGMLYQRLGEDKKSLHFIKNALALSPNDAELHLALGFHHVDNAQLQEAMENFKEHLRLDFSSQTGHLFLGRTYDFLGDLDAAEKQLIRTIALSTDQVEPHLQLGRVLLRNYKLEQAAVKFHQANEIDPGNILAEIGTKRVEAILAGEVSVASNVERSPATIVCIKQGKKYGPDYANRLHAMVMRNSTLEPRFICFTDDESGLNDGIHAKPLPDKGFHGWWNKVSLFKSDLGDVGERLLYLDLDVVITNNIDVLLTYDSDFAIMDNDYVPGFNTSVFLLKTGSRPEIRDDFNPDIVEKYSGDQDWVATMAPDAGLWPHMWCVPFRLRAAQSVPENTKVVVFSGRPNPKDYPAQWIKDYWR